MIKTTIQIDYSVDPITTHIMLLDFHDKYIADIWEPYLKLIAESFEKDHKFKNVNFTRIEK
jgi:predicted transcriptional regulator